jgi:hypothetical protein
MSWTSARMDEEPGVQGVVRRLLRGLDLKVMADADHQLGPVRRANFPSSPCCVPIVVVEMPDSTCPEGLRQSRRSVYTTRTWPP